MERDFFERPGGKRWLEKLPVREQELVDVFRPQTEVSFANLVSAFRTWNPDASSRDLARLSDAFKFMRSMHKGQLRLDGKTPAETHPYSVAFYAARSGCAVDEVISALLHDTLEDCNTTIGEIKRKFGCNVSKIVTLLSTPKIRQAVQNPTEKVSVGKGKKKKLLHLVYPEHEQYRAESTEEDGRIKKKHQRVLVDIQTKRLFPKEQAITPEQWSAILIKQFDTLHNLQTADNMSEEARQRLFTRSLDVSLFLSDKLSPVIRRSVPQHIEDQLLKAIGQKLPKEPKQSQWFAKMRFPRNYLKRSSLSKLPRVRDFIVNVHPVFEDGKQKSNVFEVLIPYSMINNSKRLEYHKNDYERLFDEFSRQLKPEGGSSSPVTREQSRLPPGLAAFHVFRLDLSYLSGVHNPEETLKDAVRNVLVRHMSTEFMELPQQLRKAIAYKLHGSQLYWLPSPARKNTYTLLFPAKHFFSPPEDTKELAETLWEKHLKSVEIEQPDKRTLPSTLTKLAVTFKPGLKEQHLRSMFSSFGQILRVWQGVSKVKQSEVERSGSANG